MNFTALYNSPRSRTAAALSWALSSDITSSPLANPADPRLATQLQLQLRLLNNHSKPSQLSQSAQSAQTRHYHITSFSLLHNKQL